MKVSIVIPCYNEKNTIEKVVEAVRNAPLNSKEIIVVDDCSQDGTQMLLREKISAVVDRVTYDPVNRRRGAAVCPGLLQRLESGKADAALGSIDRGTTTSRLFLAHGR